MKYQDYQLAHMQTFTMANAATTKELYDCVGLPGQCSFNFDPICVFFRAFKFLVC